MTTDGAAVPQATHWLCLACGEGGPVSHPLTGPPPCGGDAAARYALAVHARKHRTTTRRPT